MTPSLLANSRARTRAAYSPSLEGTKSVPLPMVSTRAVIVVSSDSVESEEADSALSNAAKSKGTVSSRLSHRKQTERISHDLGAESAG